MIDINLIFTIGPKYDFLIRLASRHVLCSLAAVLRVSRGTTHLFGINYHL
jgi:hypothetical protein